MCRDLGAQSCGPFQLNKDGLVVTANGDSLEPAITIPAQSQSITIARLWDMIPIVECSPIPRAIRLRVS